MALRGGRVRKGPPRRKQPKFETSRLQEVEYVLNSHCKNVLANQNSDKSASNDKQPGFEDNIEDDVSLAGSSVDSSESETDEKQAEKSYNTLLQLLNAGLDSNGPARKKRKLKHKEKYQETEEAQELNEAKRRNEDLDFEHDQEAKETSRNEEESDQGELDEHDDDVHDGKKHLYHTMPGISR